MTGGSYYKKSKQPNVELNQESKIFVYYVSDKLSDYDVQNLVREINASKIFENLNSICMIIQTNGDSRLECINPKYITKKELIKEHSKILEELHEQIKNKINVNGKP